MSHFGEGEVARFVAEIQNTEDLFRRRDRALEQSQLHLAYQPIVDLTTRTVIRA